MHIPNHLEIILLKGKGKSLLAKKDIKKGRVVLPVEFEVIKPYSRATAYAMQIDDNKFVDTKKFVVGDFINHSCSPSVRINFKKLNFVALRKVKKGEEITYNYLTTEYDLVRDKLDFPCNCGSKKCFKSIRGFKFLTKQQKLRLKPLLPDFLKKKIKAEKV